MAAKAGSSRAAPPAMGSAIINPPKTHNDPDAALEIQLISYVGRMQEADAAVLKAKGPLDEAKAARQKVRLNAKAAGFPLALLDQLIIDQRGNKRELIKEEADRTKFRRWLDLPVGDEAKTLFDALPVEKQDEVYWESRGYQAALRGEAAVVPDGCPQRMIKPYLDGHGTGGAKKAWADQQADALAAEANAPPPKPEAPAAAPETQAPEPELSPAARRKAEKAEEERVKAALNKPAPTALDAIAEAEPEIVAQVVEDHGDNFEATPEELAAQTGRPARAEVEEEGVS